MQQLINNFFLTGKINIGKSTILNKILQEFSNYKLRLGGFRTKPVIEDGVVKGYVFEVINGGRKFFAHIDLPTQESFDRYKINPLIFDELSIQSLESSIVNVDFIVMDEIGVIEQKAQKFRNFILKCLNSEKTVLGVYQQRARWFFELIRNRKDTIIFEISKTNRDIIYEKIADQIIKNCIK